MRGAFARAKAFRPRPTRFGRQRILQTTAELLRDRKETFARLITAESGLCWKDSLYVANRAYDVWSFAARLDIKDDGEICSCASVRTARCAKSTRRARRTAVKRIRVVDRVANRFADKVPPRAAALKCGDPMDPATDVGTVINQRSARLFEARVTDTLAHGAERIYGGERRGALSPPPAVVDRVPFERELARARRRSGW